MWGKYQTESSTHPATTSFQDKTIKKETINAEMTVAKPKKEFVWRISQSLFTTSANRAKAAKSETYNFVILGKYNMLSSHPTIEFHLGIRIVRNMRKNEKIIFLEVFWISTSAVYSW